MKNNLDQTELYKEIISEKNIYSAIFCVDSYIFEKDLLSKPDKEMLNHLGDKYDFEYIENHIMAQCIKKIKQIITVDDELFNISVYLRPKKLKEDISTKQKFIEFRPLHTCCLIDMICIVAMLNKIIYEDTKSNHRKLSDLSKMIPHNFYGNIPSTEPEMLFHRWQDKYKRYTDDYMTEYKSCAKNAKYLYEISLDLVNFFPSINPGIIYNYILEILSPKYKGQEKECLKAVLRKLLYFKVSNIDECYRYYYTNLAPNISTEEIFNTLSSGDMYYSVGIPQGLPQAYYFGNLCMIKVSSIFDRNFPGKSFYYVDDSVIFSNLISNTHIDENNLDIIFADRLKEVNSELMKLSKEADSDIDDQCNGNEKLKTFISYIDYTIRVHTENKSSISIISESKKKYGEFFINSMNRQTSKCTSEMFSTFNETDDSSIRTKIQTILQGIDKEVNRIKHQISIEEAKVQNTLKESQSIREYRHYLKKLSRFKRFYKLRQKIMDFRTDNEISEKSVEEFSQRFMLDKIINAFYSKSNEYYDLLNSFFEIFDEDIFLNEARFDIINIRKSKLKESFITKIKSFDKVLFQNTKDISNFSYFSKFISNYEDASIFAYHKDEYESINKFILKKYNNFSKVKDTVKINFIKEYIKFNMKDSSSICALYGKNYLALVLGPSTRIVRMTLNAIFSHIFNVRASDNFQIQQNDNRALKYFELRILSYLKNSNFNLYAFKHFLSDVIDELDHTYGLESIDHTIFEVLYMFRRFVKRPVYIDNIIQIHKYVSGIWKNGSKFLNFYTLHNQEHAIELIKVSISFLNCLDYLRISETDYYILFLSCYLHDISMVLHPDIQSFVSDNFDTDIIYTDFKKEIASYKDQIELLPKSTIKNLILNYFKKVDNYFESSARSMHPKESAKFIRQTTDLKFLEDIIKEHVAIASESHGYDTIDVYGLKSKAKDSLISQKYIMIILRFADLMDMTKDRVSVNIMKHNLQHMPEISKFHWISHSVIERNQLETKYHFNDKSKKYGESYLQKKFFKETFIITIKLNTQLLIKTICKERCQYIASCNINVGGEKPQILLKISSKSTEQCKCPDTTLICKWMAIKNYYLYKELNALQVYLNRNENNWFDTDIEVHLDLEDKDILSSEYLDIVRNYLKDK